MQLSMHYTIDTEPERRVMVEKIYGTWDIATARQYHEDFKEAAGPLVGKKWAKIVNLTSWKASHPDMIKIIGEHLKWCKDNGMVLSINIIDNPITRRKMKKMFNIGGTGDVSRMVRDRSEAERLLTQNGF